MDEAIDRLEGLRYAWRGDRLETALLKRLGEMYLRAGQFRKGFSVMRSASSDAPFPPDGKQIAEDMRAAFKALFVGPEADRIEPLKAITIFKEFPELVPLGRAGDAVKKKFAERLVQVDFLGEAGDILEDLVRNRLKATEAAKTGARLAAIRLLDTQPEAALEALNVSFKNDVEWTSALVQERELLRAKALSELDQAQEALEILDRLNNTEKTRRLRVDIAWKAGRWADAARSLNDLIDIKDSFDGELDVDNARLILNQAVAHNLSGNARRLADHRRKYLSVMEKTEFARLYTLVTRPQKAAFLSDKQTLMGIVEEADLFKDVLSTLGADIAAPAGQ